MVVPCVLVSEVISGKPEACPKAPDICLEWQARMWRLQPEAECRHLQPAHQDAISLGDVGDNASFLGFRGSVPLLPHLCPLSVPEVGVCGVYSESP